MRLAERTRIAPELHATLLQSFASASMQLHHRRSTQSLRAHDQRAYKNMLSKLGANDRTHAVSIGLRRGLLRE
ncbi:MAG: hypothetical protein JOZ33_06865 [Acidobacteriaceae bacterium]|nr:hypothetical protein [Acidobacteriaceae bacterium]